MATTLLGSSKVKVTEKHTQNTIEIDFAPPYKRISIIPELEKCIGKKLPDLNNPGEFF